MNEYRIKEYALLITLVATIILVSIEFRRVNRVRIS